jgi:CDP-glycerol glycerophosphotransferase (TagB/SpsB family)
MSLSQTLDKLSHKEADFQASQEQVRRLQEEIEAAHERERKLQAANTEMQQTCETQRQTMDQIS